MARPPHFDGPAATCCAWRNGRWRKVSVPVGMLALAGLAPSVVEAVSGWEGRMDHDNFSDAVKVLHLALARFEQSPETRALLRLAGGPREPLRPGRQTPSRDEVADLLRLFAGLYQTGELDRWVAACEQIFVRRLDPRATLPQFPARLERRRSPDRRTADRRTANRRTADRRSIDRM